jgi:hypothetical protein
MITMMMILSGVNGPHPLQVRALTAECRKLRECVDGYLHGHNSSTIFVQVSLCLIYIQVV